MGEVQGAMFGYPDVVVPKEKRKVTPALQAMAERNVIMAFLRLGPAITSTIAQAVRDEMDGHTVTLRVKELRLNGKVRNGGKQMRLGGGYDTLWVRHG